MLGPAFVPFVSLVVKIHPRLGKSSDRSRESFSDLALQGSNSVPSPPSSVPSVVKPTYGFGVLGMYWMMPVAIVKRSFFSSLIISAPAISTGP